MPDPKPPPPMLADMADALDDADDAVRAAWERIRIEPEAWRRASGARAWAVAVSGTEVWSYDDAEQTFAVSPFIVRGLVAEPGGTVQDFASVLESLPEAAEAEAFAGRAPASAVPAELEVAGRIGRQRTTSWELRPVSGGVVRVHFTGKREARLAGAAYERVALLERHPLLADFEGAWAAVYVAGAQRVGPRLVEELGRRVEAATDGWRTAAEYLARGGYGALDAGNGLLLRAPEPIARLAVDVAAEVGAEASLVPYPAGTGERRAGEKVRVLIVGRSFVVAEAFRFVRVG